MEWCIKWAYERQHQVSGSGKETGTGYCEQDYSSTSSYFDSKDLNSAQDISEDNQITSNAKNSHNPKPEPYERDAYEKTREETESHLQADREASNWCSAWFFPKDKNSTIATTEWFCQAQTQIANTPSEASCISHSTHGFLRFKDLHCTSTN